MIEKTCIHCGKKIVVQRDTAKWCSNSCRDKHRWQLVKQGLIPYERPAGTECPHNEGVDCTRHKCRACGWNPAVAKKRMEAVYG